PYHVEGRTPHDVERIICESEPEQPSRAITRVERLAGIATDAPAITPDSITRSRGTQLNQLRRRLTGDLDNIALMALRKSPEQRSVTVADFSDDIRRHLEGLPVSARKATAGSRIAKWIRRNRTVFTATAVIVVLLVAMAVTASIQSIRTARERD